MSKMEILAALPKLAWEERREIFERIGELEEHDLLEGGVPTAGEKTLLDRESEEFQQNPDAGSSWDEVQSRIRKSPRP
jgi:hypothetical protein